MRQEARPVGLAAIEHAMSDTPPPTVRTFQNRAMALGLAVEYLMKKPAFAKLPFGHWSRVLTGQIRRGHYVFVIQGNKVVGFGGWAAASEAEAEAWLAGQPNATEISGSGGDSAVINAWAADGPEVNDMLVAEAMRRTEEFRMVYAKREYEDGRTRPVRMPTKRGESAGNDSPIAE
jgi:hemolysin-activating ACP:hemolysin acyltransferase